MIVVFLGPPGSGKGTQSDLLAERHGFCHFDTGSRLRAESASGSELGARIASFTDRGQLVPLEIIRDLVLSFLASPPSARILFDGFPRNLAQAEVLDEGLTHLGIDLDCALYLDLDEQQLMQRIVNRRFCSKCGEIYNLGSRPPQRAGICDLDGAELIQRKDDTAEVFRQRWLVFMEQTLPVLEHYRKSFKLRMIDGNTGIEEVAGTIAGVLDLGGEHAA